jgi:hypothetical protein
LVPGDTSGGACEDRAKDARNGARGRLQEVDPDMSETTENVCHWEKVQRQWKWEWASYNTHTTGVFWTASGAETTDLIDRADFAPEAPELEVDQCYGSRWEKVSGTGHNVVLETVDLPEGVEPAGEGWRVAETVGR